MYSSQILVAKVKFWLVWLLFLLTL